MLTSYFSHRPKARTRFARNAKVRLWPTVVVLQARRPHPLSREFDAPLTLDRAGTPAATFDSIRRCWMSQSEKIHSRIHSIDERLARLRARRERLLARAGHAERKRDTRRKILIGGAVLAAIDREGIPSMRSAIELRRWLDERLVRPHDREVFGLDAGYSSKQLSIRPSEPPTQSDTAVKDAGQRPAPRSGAPRP